MEKVTKEELNRWLQSQETNEEDLREDSELGIDENIIEKRIFNEAEKLKNKENLYQLSMIEQTFTFWKKLELARESRKMHLLRAFGRLSILQTMFIMVLVVLSAVLDTFYIYERIFISVIFGTLVQIVGVVMVITKSSFNEKDDKVIDFISQWIKRT